MNIQNFQADGDHYSSISESVRFYWQKRDVATALVPGTRCTAIKVSQKYDLARNSIVKLRNFLISIVMMCDNFIRTDDPRPACVIDESSCASSDICFPCDGAVCCCSREWRWSLSVEHSSSFHT